VPERFDVIRFGVRKRVANVFRYACQWISDPQVNYLNELLVARVFSVAVASRSYSKVGVLYDGKATQ